MVNSHPLYHGRATGDTLIITFILYHIKRVLSRDIFAGDFFPGSGKQESLSAKGVGAGVLIKDSLIKNISLGTCILYRLLKHSQFKGPLLAWRVISNNPLMSADGVKRGSDRDMAIGTADRQR